MPVNIVTLMWSTVNTKYISKINTDEETEGDKMTLVTETLDCEKKNGSNITN